MQSLTLQQPYQHMLSHVTITCYRLHLLHGGFGPCLPHYINFFRPCATRTRATCPGNVPPHSLQGFRGEFLWQGTSDPCAWLAVPASLAVLRALGPQRVAQHNARLVSEAAAALRRRWEAAAGGCSSGSSGGDGDGASSRAEPSAAGKLGGEGETREGRGAGGAAASGEGAGGGGRRLVQLGGGGEWGAGEQGAGVAGMLALELPPMAGYGCTAGDAVRLQRWLRGERNIEVRCWRRGLWCGGTQVGLAKEGASESRGL